METITDILIMQERCLKKRAEGQIIAFVPTMGYLHEGHLSLLREGRRRGDFLVLSIFVNPTQFGQNEDLDRYPRDFKRDEALAREAGVDLIFYPCAESMYPNGYASYVTVEGPLTTTLEGASRPTHFRGVSTVVAKLFAIVMPHIGLFGQKDFQQLAVIQQLTADLNFPVEVVGMPIVRETDGLAMSSRNVYLSQDERIQALTISESLRTAIAVVREGETDAKAVLDSVMQRISETDLKIDYVKICHAKTLKEAGQVDQNSVLLIAVKIGQTRLIDNCFLMEKSG